MKNGGFEFIIKAAAWLFTYFRPQNIDCRNCGFFYLPQGSFVYGFIFYPTSGQLVPK